MIYKYICVIARQQLLVDLRVDIRLCYFVGHLVLPEYVSLYMIYDLIVLFIHLTYFGSSYSLFNCVSDGWMDVWMYGWMY